MDMKWIAEDGVIRDQFTMMKNVNKKTTVKARKGQPITLTASFVGSYKWSWGSKTTRSIQIIPTSRTKIYTVFDEFGCVKDTLEVIASK